MDEAAAYSEQDLVSNDPITVVLSDKGWVRAAKGHELDPAELNYKSGDSFRHAVRGRTNELLVFPRFHGTQPIRSPRPVCRRRADRANH